MTDTPHDPASAETDTAAPPLIVLRASGPRRVFAVLVMGMLAAILLWLAGTAQAGFAFSLLFLALGLAALWAAWKLWEATAGAVVLTEAGLTDASGAMLVPMEQIAGVDRGFFAFKPSNGFVLKLASRAAPGWAPGLWWRTGRRFGVGGVTPSAQARAMADMIAIRLAGQAG